MNPDQDVWYSDKLEVCLLGVGEVNLGLPDGLDETRISQVQRRLDVRVRKARVRPLLPQVCIGYIVLKV